MSKKTIKNLDGICFQVPEDPVRDVPAPVSLGQSPRFQNLRREPQRGPVLLLHLLEGPDQRGQELQTEAASAGQRSQRPQV